jgi:hypothetical protein
VEVSAAVGQRRWALLAVVAMLAACGTANDSQSVDPSQPAACDPHAAIPGVIREGNSPQSTEFLQQDPLKGTLPGSPLDELPSHITQITDSGQRANWSPDGSKMLYLDDTIGDVVELELATGATRDLTAPFPNAGFLRAHYLPNGDLLLCGPLQRDPAIEDDGRFRGLLWVQRAPFDAAPVRLDEPCWEGVAVDRQSDAIAWNISNIDFNAADVFIQALTGTSEIHTGRIVYDADGVPQLADKELVIDRWDVSPDAIIEVQDFRTRVDGSRELIFSAYFHRGGEVMGVDLATHAITGYSRSPFYEEPEGIDPAGAYILVERDRAFELFPGELDIWRLTLDGSGSFERMTTFNHYCGYGATNPVVAPDGAKFAFQLERKADGPLGAGHGLLLFDIEAWNAAHPEGGAPDPFLLPREIIVPLPL